jgi:ABC-type transporter Mla subunit MlaD
MALAQISLALAVVGVVAVILVIGVIALVGSAVSGIFTASLYRYATKGDAGQLYRPETLSAAFRQKA